MNRIDLEQCRHWRLPERVVFLLYLPKRFTLYPLGFGQRMIVGD